MLRAAADAAARLQGAAFRPATDRDLRRLRFPYGLAARRAYPPLAARPFARPGPRRKAGARPRVLLFPGCMVTYVYPGIGDASVAGAGSGGRRRRHPARGRLLRRAAGGPRRPPRAPPTSRACSSISSRASEFDALVAACPTCTSSFVHRYPRLLAGEPRYAARARALAARSYDITSYLADVLHVSRPTGRLEATVTYHDPCHLARGLGVTRQPRELLASIPGVRLSEMREPSRCCGGAGSFSLTHQELSLAIGARKAADIVADRRRGRGHELPRLPHAARRRARPGRRLAAGRAHCGTAGRGRRRSRMMTIRLLASTGGDGTAT